MGAMPATNEGVSLTTDIDSHEVTDGSSLPALNSACNGAFQLLRNTKRVLSLEQQLLQIAQEELAQTVKTIEADRQKITALQQEQTFTARQIKEAMSQDAKRFETILGSKQPDLLRYCNELTSTRHCLQAIRSIRHCKHHIQLAELIVTNRYATLLAERSTDSAESGGKTTSSAVATLGSMPFTAPSSHINDAATAAASSSLTARKLRRLSLHGPSSSSSSSCVSGGKTSVSVSSSLTDRSSSTTANNDLPGIVRIEIRDRDAPRPGVRDQLLKPLAQTQSAGCGTASKPQKSTKT